LRRPFSGIKHSENEPPHSSSLSEHRRERTATPVRAFAVRLHATGCSLRETKEFHRLFGVERSHQAICPETVLVSEGHGDSVTFVNGFRFVEDLIAGDS